MRIATVEKEWAEVRRKGRGKVEDWSWTVTFYEADDRIDSIDQHYINNEVDARMIASLFMNGIFTIGEFSEVDFTEVFEDVLPFDLELEEMFEGEVDDSTLVFEVINE